jgi:hypothetical protein
MLRNHCAAASQHGQQHYTSSLSSFACANPAPSPLPLAVVSSASSPARVSTGSWTTWACCAAPTHHPAAIARLHCVVLTSHSTPHVCLAASFGSERERERQRDSQRERARRERMMSTHARRQQVHGQQHREPTTPIVATKPSITKKEENPPTPLRKTAFLSHLYIKTMILPRQARDNHRETTQKNAVFPTPPARPAPTEHCPLLHVERVYQNTVSVSYYGSNGSRSLVSTNQH